MKKVFRVSMSFVLLVVLLFAFVFSIDIFAAGAKEDSEPQGERVIKLITSTGSLSKALPDEIARFNEINKGRIRVEADAESMSSLLERYMTQFVSKTPTYDIIAVDSKWCRRLEKFLVTLEPYLKRDGLDPDKAYGPAQINTRRSKEKGTTTLPVSAAVHILFYRTDLLREAGLSVPKSLNEYLEAARKLTKRNANGDVEIYGLGGLRAMGVGDSAQSLVYFLQPMGGRVLTLDKTDAHPSLKEKVTIETLEFLAQVAKEGLCPNPLSWDQYADRPAFAQGKLAMSVIYSPIAQMVEDPKQSSVAGKVGYAPVVLKPTGPEKPAIYASGWGLGIDSNSKNKNAAWEFIKFITLNKDTQKRMAMSGKNDPSMLEVFNDKEYQAKVKSAGAIQDIMTNIGLDLPSDIEKGNEVEKIIHEEMQQLWAWKKSPTEVANAMYERIHKLMKP